MSVRRLQLERVRINLHGVSAELAQAAISGLESELRRRLGATVTAELQHGEQVDLRLDAVDAPPGTSAAALRRVIAQRLIDGLQGGSH